jgi:hypothetical protein
MATTNDDRARRIALPENREAIRRLTSLAPASDDPRWVTQRFPTPIAAA